jgi:hypothetical protein
MSEKLRQKSEHFIFFINIFFHSLFCFSTDDEIRNTVYQAKFENIQSRIENKGVSADRGRPSMRWMDQFA